MQILGNHVKRRLIMVRERFLLDPHGIERWQAGE